MAYQSSSPAPFETPVKRKLKLASLSDFSSPGSPSQLSSPISAATERRRSQYKSHSSSVTSSASTSTYRRKPSALFTGDDSEKAAARKKFQDQCFQRAAKARRTAVKRKRYSASSPSMFDDDAMDDDVEEDDDDIMHDEFFRRIAQSANEKRLYQYAVSFEREVGSPIDPDKELELCEPEPELTPEDLEAAELEAYAQECERQAVLSNFEDLTADDLYFLEEDLEDFDSAMDV